MSSIDEDKKQGDQVSPVIEPTELIYREEQQQATVKSSRESLGVHRTLPFD